MITPVGIRVKYFFCSGKKNLSLVEKIRSKRDIQIYPIQNWVKWLSRKRLPPLKKPPSVSTYSISDNLTNWENFACLAPFAFNDKLGGATNTAKKCTCLVFFSFTKVIRLHSCKHF